ncbi:hypothetical protein LPJ61_001348, partial [Coemansia biformis]
MSHVALSCEDSEMIEKCVDMISMQCRMIANMLRRARDASGAAARNHHDFSPSESNEGMVDRLSNAAATLAATARHVTADLGPHADSQDVTRKRQRARYGSALPDAYDDVHPGLEGPNLHASTPPPAKRRGRPPRDYGDELGPAFAVYASEYYQRTEHAFLERAGGPPGSRVPKSEVLRAIWDAWWLSSQATKDKYLSLSRHEMVVNETHMLELLLDYPLPGEALAAQASLRHNSARMPSRSPEPLTAFDVFVREQIPLLRSKVPDWSDSEIHRRLSVNWNSMAPAEREKYAVLAAVSTTAGSQSHSMYPTLPHSAAATPTHTVLTPRGSAGGPGIKSGPRTLGQSVPRRAYVLFCRQERPLLVQANPQWDLPTVNKELGRRWKELTAEQKEAYHDLERRECELRAAQAGVSPAASVGFGHGREPYGARAALDSSSTGYRRGASYADSTQYTPTGPAGGRTLGGGSAGSMPPRATARSGTLGSGNPNKGPSRAYVFYSRLNRKGVTSEHPDWDLATVNRELGRMWKALSLDERQSWEGRASTVVGGGPADSESTTSTPHLRASPETSAHATAGASTVTPSPTPAALQPAAENGATSGPVTPASEVMTPTPKDDGALPGPHGPEDDGDGDGEGVAEDVEMQDDDTEDDESRDKGRTLSGSTTYASP